MSARTDERAATLLANGFHELQKGRAEQARVFGQKALEIAPRNPDALQLLGVIALQRADHAAAADLFKRAIAARPGDAASHCNLAYACIGLQRLPEAVAAFEQAAQLEPGDPELQLGHGNCLAMTGRIAEAETIFRRLVERYPQYPLGWFNLANAVRTQERYDEARDFYLRVIRLAPGHVQSHIELGATLLKLEQPTAALERFREAEALNSNSPDLYVGWGVALRELGAVEEAVSRIERALALKPDFAEAWLQMGNALSRLDQADRARQCLERAVSLAPDHAGARNNLGMVLWQAGEYDGALAELHKALALKPRYPEAHYNMAMVHVHQDRAQEGLESLEQAISYRPYFADATFSRSLLRLMRGDFERGWKDYEWRFRRDLAEEPIGIRPFSQREWRGEPLAGRTILVWGEQGIGDQLLHAAMIGEVAAASARCVFECASKLVPLFARSFPQAVVVASRTPPHETTQAEFDYQVPAGDLARWLRAAPGDFPRHGGYLLPDPARVAYWKDRLAALGAGPKIGFAWRSSNLKGERAPADIKLDYWRPVFSASGAHFICLQYGECMGDLHVARERLGVQLHAFPEIDLFNDLDEAAALTKAVDLVVSAPTAVSTLSAALGVPTWQLSFGLDWQRLGTDANPWFPAMRVFWRRWNQSWEDVILGLGRELVPELERR